MAKIAVAESIIEQVKALAPVMDNAPDRVQEYYDAGTWADEDVAALGITAAQLSSCVVLLEQITALMSGNATTPALYRFNVNAVRRL